MKTAFFPMKFTDKVQLTSAREKEAYYNFPIVVLILTIHKCVAGIIPQHTKSLHSAISTNLILFTKTQPALFNQ